MSQDPYGAYPSPGGYGGGSDVEAVKGRLLIPAILMIVFAVLHILWSLYTIVSVLFMPQQDPRLTNPNITEEQAEMVEAMTTPVGVAFGVFGLIVALIVILGAMNLMKARGYGLAMTASILSVIPCITPCCVLGIPWGIWSLVLLTNAEVKQAFAANA